MEMRGQNKLWLTQKSFPVLGTRVGTLICANDPWSGPGPCKLVIHHVCTRMTRKVAEHCPVVLVWTIPATALALIGVRPPQSLTVWMFIGASGPPFFPIRTWGQLEFNVTQLTFDKAEETDINGLIALRLVRVFLRVCRPHDLTWARTEPITRNSRLIVCNWSVFHFIVDLHLTWPSWSRNGINNNRLQLVSCGMILFHTPDMRYTGLGCQWV